MRTIEFSLSKDSIENAIKELKEYQANIINANKVFCDELTQIGIPVASAILQTDGNGDSDRSGNFSVAFDVDGNATTATLSLQGSAVVFWEFGAGIYFNTPIGTSPHPKGAEKGFTIGSYGHGRGKQEWWLHYNSSGKLVWTHGTEATMPMFHASLEMAQNIQVIARKAFGNL